jgi:hypothetical protein
LQTSPLMKSPSMEARSIRQTTKGPG